MLTRTTSEYSGICSLLVAAIAAVQVVALAVLVERDTGLGERLAPAPAGEPVMLPEIVVTAPRIQP